MQRRADNFSNQPNQSTTDAIIVDRSGTFNAMHEKIKKLAAKYTQANPFIVEIQYRKCWAYDSAKLAEEFKTLKDTVQAYNSFIEKAQLQYPHIKYSFKLYLYKNSENQERVKEWDKHASNFFEQLKKQNQLVDDIEAWRKEEPIKQAREAVKKCFVDYFNEAVVESQKLTNNQETKLIGADIVKRLTAKIHYEKALNADIEAYLNKNRIILATPIENNLEDYKKQLNEVKTQLLHYLSLIEDQTVKDSLTLDHNLGEPKSLTDYQEQFNYFSEILHRVHQQYCMEHIVNENYDVLASAVPNARHFKNNKISDAIPAPQQFTAVMADHGHSKSSICLRKIAEDAGYFPESYELFTNKGKPIPIVNHTAYPSRNHAQSKRKKSPSPPSSSSSYPNNSPPSPPSSPPNPPRIKSGGSSGSISEESDSERDPSPTRIKMNNDSTELKRAKSDPTAFSTNALVTTRLRNQQVTAPQPVALTPIYPKPAFASTPAEQKVGTVVVNLTIGLYQGGAPIDKIVEAAYLAVERGEKKFTPEKPSI